MMQPQGHIQLMVNVLDARMGLQEAIDVPRYRILDGLDVTVEDGADRDRVRWHDLQGGRRQHCGRTQGICSLAVAGAKTRSVPLTCGSRAAAC